MHPGEFREGQKIIIFDDVKCIKYMLDLEESASHPSPPPWRGAPSLHAKFYLYEHDFLPSGVSVVALSVDDTPEESIFSGP